MSLKGDKYENAEEVRFRLESSVVLYDGKPVFISRIGFPEAEDVGEIARVYFYNLPLSNADIAQDKKMRKYLSSRKFDLSPFKMGYANIKGQAMFISRSPVRQNRQGLSANNIMIANIKGKRVGDLNFNGLIASQGFVDMVNGKYPTFAEAGALLGDQEYSSVAISRKFAFFIDHDLESLFLMHKGIRCGLAMKNDRALKVPPKFHFLKEEMEECRIPIA